MKQRTDKSLASEYRPKTLAQVLGQERYVAAFKNMLQGKETLGGHKLALPSVLLIAGPSGTGKCLAEDTPVLMFDGSVRPVQNVRVGDQVMGPDSTPRTVLSLCSGTDQMYKVTPIKGEPYTVNEAHILSLRMSVSTGKYKQGQVVNISIKDYLQETPQFRLYAKGYRASINFPYRMVPLDPYMLGLWLGDGSAGTSRITTADPEIVQYMQEYCDVHHTIEAPGQKQLQLVTIQDKGAAKAYALTSGRTGGLKSRNPLVASLKVLNVYNVKSIPELYKVNSEDVRLGLLAGLIDSDGSLSCNGYEVATKHAHIAQDVVYIARSLGFGAYAKARTTCNTHKGEKRCFSSYRVTITGDVNRIPVLIERKKASPRRSPKNVLNVGITVESTGPGKYFGFELDGDKLFVLGDFTVTHNSTLARILAASAMCKSFNAETCEPCGECNDCSAALAGVRGDINFFFIDGSGKGMKELVEEDLKRFFAASPFGGARKRVCIADEAQALSVGARNVLLTLTENLPPSAMIIYTTTDPEAIDQAVRTRAVPIYLAPLNPEQLVDGVIRHRPEYDTVQGRESLTMLTAHVDGSMRAMWKLLEVLEAFAEELTPDLVTEVSGGASDTARTKLWKAFEAGDYDKLQKAWTACALVGANLDRLATQLIDDVMVKAAAEPMARDWAQLIARLSQAQILKAPKGCLWALMSCIESPSRKVEGVEGGALAAAVAGKLLGPLEEIIKAIPDPVAVYERFYDLAAIAVESEPEFNVEDPISVTRFLLGKPA